MDAALAAYEGERGQSQHRATVASVESRLARLRDLYELGDVTKDEYLRRREALRRVREALTEQAEPTFVRQLT